VQVALLTLSYGFGKDHLLGFASLLHVGRELSVPTWYSSKTLFVAALAICLIAWINAHQKRTDTYYWIGLAIMFFSFRWMNRSNCTKS